MPYQYGMQTSPSGGNGLGGLPKKQTTPTQVNFTKIVTAGSGTIVPPANAKYMRVCVVGAGGRGFPGTGTGGGGGCAATKIVSASPIQYTVGGAHPNNSPATGFNGAPSTASFPGYNLVAGGGTVAAPGLGGVGSGGDYNYTGGNGDANTSGNGGGAAGPSGNGGAGGQNAPAVGPGWGCGGGGGGGGGGSDSNGGGGGSGAIGTFYTANFTVTYYIGSTFFGGAGADGRGGQMGGGGGANSTGAGGVGGIVVEWFY